MTPGAIEIYMFTSPQLFFPKVEIFSKSRVFLSFISLSVPCYIIVSLTPLHLSTYVFSM